MPGSFLDPSHCFLIEIGDNCTLAPNVRIMAHDASMKKIMGVARVGRVIIHNNCFLGDSTIVLPGVSIGPNSIIGAGSVVSRNIPPDSVAVGNPAQVIMPIADFISKHEKNMYHHTCFPESQFNIAVISAAGKKQMLDYLGTSGIAYMKKTQFGERKF